MASVSVLYIEDKIVAPHLELIRNICEPKSKSRPHITVRYFDKLSIPEDHLKSKVTNIDFMGISSFGLDEESSQRNKTVLIRCQADELISLEHKPLFPMSYFHITLYDGDSREFASSLSALLEKFEWNFRLELPKNTALKEIVLSRKKKSKIVDVDRVYKPEISRLFKKISGLSLSLDLIESLPNSMRLDYVEKICENLQLKISRFEKIDATLVDQHSAVLSSPESDKDYQMHLTPPELAAEIAKVAVAYLDSDQRSAIDFGDPAVGTGAFFAALLSTVPPDSIRSAVGVDISPRHVAAARWRWDSKNMQVIEGDYLHMNKLPLRNLVLANPPYLRHQSIPSKYKQELRERASADLGMIISGLSGQYIYFLLLSHKWMTPGAIAAWLIPSEFMQTTYGKALRFYLSRKVNLLRIHQFGSKKPQFENAETLPCLVVFRNDVPKPNSRAVFTSGDSLEFPESTYDTYLNNLDPENRWSIQPKSVRLRDSSSVRLGDLFSVRRGIATGANDFFILDSKTVEVLELPRSFIKAILPKAKSLESDVIEAAPDGTPNIQKQLFVIDTTCDIDEIKEKYPKFAAYLDKGISDGVLSRNLVARRKPWYRQEKREPAPFLCTYMGKAHGDRPAIRFILNKSQAIASNTYLMLYPNESLSRLIKYNPEITDILFSLLKDASKNAVSEYSRLHAGGLNKIEPRELLEVWLGPLPESLREVAFQHLFR